MGVLLPDKGSRASAGAHPHRVRSPDRPARRQAHRTGTVAASPKRSPAADRPGYKRDRPAVWASTHACGRTRKPGVAECWRYPDERFLGERLSGRGHSRDAIGPVGS
jgi:hypothetical protein